MKTKISSIYLLIAFSTFVFTGCKKESIQGPAGQDATVYYSEWIAPTEWLGSSGDWYFDVVAPDLTEDIVENGVILAYAWLADDIYDAATVRPLPAYAVDANWSFLVFEFESIEFTSDMILKPFTSSNRFRYVAIPGNTPALKSASLKNIGIPELRKMPYKEVCKLFNIPE